MTAHIEHQGCRQLVTATGQLESGGERERERLRCEVNGEFQIDLMIHHLCVIGSRYTTAMGNESIRSLFHQKKSRFFEILIKSFHLMMMMISKMESN